MRIISFDNVEFVRAILEGKKIRWVMQMSPNRKLTWLITLWVMVR